MFVLCVVLIERIWIVCRGFFVIDFTIDWWDSFSCLFWRFVFLVVLIEWLRGLFVVIVWCDWLFLLVVFLLNGCDFVRKKKNYGRTVHCNVAFVKLYVKMSARWFRIQAVDLLIWTCIVCCENAFMFWTSLCERHKFNRLPNSDGYCSYVEENAAGCSGLF